MNIRQELAKKIKLDNVTVDELVQSFTIPPSIEMGDFALPCFAFAKAQRRNPNEIASEIASSLVNDELIERAEVVNGYVNIYLNKSTVTDKILSNFAETKELKPLNIGDGKIVCIDFSSVNVAKNPHIGHFSSTVIGACIARLYEKLGFEVKRLNYLGDYGTQFGKLVCAYIKWGNREDVQKRGIEALQELYIRVNAECEKDEALLQECRDTFKKMEEHDPFVMELFEWFKDLSIAEVKKNLFEPLKLSFDDWRGEQYYSQFTDDVLQQLTSSGLAKESQGALVVDLEQYGLGVAVVRQSNGTTLYLTRDIATAINRYGEYAFDVCIYITGVEQKLHFAQLFKILELMGNEWADKLLHLVNGRLRLPDGKLSSRKGNQALAKDIIAVATQKACDIIKERSPDKAFDVDKAQQIGLGALIFSALKSGMSKDSVFVLEDAINFDGQTGPYLMYTHARCASVLRKAPVLTTDISNYGIDSDASWELVGCLNKYQDILLEAYQQKEPSVIARYLIELAGHFNKFYHDNRILSDDEASTKKNLTITRFVKYVLNDGLAILGISSPEEM